MKSERTRQEKRQIVAAQVHPLAWWIRQAARRLGSAEASATTWLQLLNRRADETARSSKEWPKNPNQLGRILGELTPGLLLLGVEVRSRRNGRGRFWRIESAEFAAARCHHEATQKIFGDPRPAQRPDSQAEIAAIRADFKQRERKTG